MCRNPPTTVVNSTAEQISLAECVYSYGWDGRADLLLCSLRHGGMCLLPNGIRRMPTTINRSFRLLLPILSYHSFLYILGLNADTSPLTNIIADCVERWDYEQRQKGCH